MTGVTIQDGQAGLPTPQSTTSYWHREPSQKLIGHQTTEKLPQSADVVIIGSGITGAFAARELVAGGRSVLMMEAREACWGATGRNGGHCQPGVYYGKPDVARFELATFNFLNDIITKHDIPCDWQVVGGVHRFPTTSMVDAAAKVLDRLRRDHPDLAEKATLYRDRETLEALRVPDAAGAIVQSCAARCWPYKLVAWVLETLLNGNGAEIKFNLQTTTPVTYLQQMEDCWVVHTPRGQVVAKDVLLATNAYTSYLLPRMKGLIVPVRGQVCTLKPPTGDRSLDHSYVWLEGGGDDYLIQRNDGDLIMGGERLAIPGGEEGIWHDDAINPTLARKLRQALYSNVKLRPPGDDEEEELKATYEWTGIMGYSRDHAPWVGRVPETLGGGRGLWVCAGFTGHGMPVAARCAVAVCEKMLGRGEGGVEMPGDFVISEERAERARGLDMLHRSVFEEVSAA